MKIWWIRCKWSKNYIIRSIMRGLASITNRLWSRFRRLIGSWRRWVNCWKRMLFCRRSWGRVKCWGRSLWRGIMCWIKKLRGLSERIRSRVNRLWSCRKELRILMLWSLQVYIYLLYIYLFILLFLISNCKSSY